MDRDEFLKRFKAEMVRLAPFTHFKNDDGEDDQTVADYAEMTAPTYWDDEGARAEGPEECAHADMSYWGE